MHICKKCGRGFVVRIDVDQQTILSASCPFCSEPGYFDNRYGKLKGRTTSLYDIDPEQINKSQEQKKTGTKRGNRSKRNWTRLFERKPARTGSGTKGIFYNPLRLLSLPAFDPKRLSAKVILVGGIVLTGLLTVSIYSAFFSGNFEMYAKRMDGVRPNRIVDARGHLVAELFSEKTGSLTFDRIPDQLKNIVIYVEDQNFYEHGGIHWPSIFRAFLKNIITFGYSQGGSTITQQLSRILMRTHEKTIIRKIKEARFAYYLEDRFSKQEILTAYLNNVYLGHGAIGVESAAQFYFEKGVEELNFIEMLILACLPSAPERLSPVKNPHLLEAKMDSVYERMIDDDVAPYPEEEYQNRKMDVFKNITRGPQESVFGTRVNDAAYVGEYIRIKLKELFGEDQQFSAGLTIETTLNGRLQNAARKETDKHIRKISQHVRPVEYDENNKIKWGMTISEKIKTEYARRGLAPVLFGLPQPSETRESLEAAAIGIDPTTGEILFMQGGSKFSSTNQFNRALQMHRQTGSAIKPIVYSAAIENGVVTAASIIEDTPIFHASKTDGAESAEDPEYWLPGNISGVYEGKISVRRALAFSKNVPAIRIAKMTGMERLSNQFRKFFFFTDGTFRKRFRRDYTIAIGTLEMTPFEMALAYSAFGNNGVIKRPFLIRRIVSADGEVLYSGEGKDEFHTGLPEEVRVLSGDVADVMASLMHDSAAHGGTGIGGEFLGKTGTTNHYKDAWFIGVLPGLSAAVWVGFDDPKYSMPGSTGASVAGPLFGRIISHGYPVHGHFVFTPAAKRIVVCKASGLLATKLCPNPVTEVFTEDNVPTETCPIHIKRKPDNNWSINQDTDFQ